MGGRWIERTIGMISMANHVSAMLKFGIKFNSTSGESVLGADGPSTTDLPSWKIVQVGIQLGLGKSRIHQVLGQKVRLNVYFSIGADSPRGIVNLFKL
jgi:hypothetical protein